jgi:hypothetical protein
MYNISRIIEVAANEIGYLEKNSKSSLESKTANAGNKNYTKYWDDIYPAFQGQPWCLCFIIWCFTKAYGDAEAKKLLKMPAYTFYTPTSAQYFKNAKQWYKTPQIGDIIYFKNSSRICHVGLVYKVDNTKVYTIEGNTNGGSTLEANGGAVAKKSYPLNYSRIAGYGRPDYKDPVIIQLPDGIIKKGKKGNPVLMIQKALNFIGYKLIEDGDFGPKTENALKDFQAKYNLEVDGEYGPQTKKALEGALGL